MNKKKIRKNPLINTLMFLCYGILVIYAYINSSRVINNLLVLITILLVVDGIYFWQVHQKVKVELQLDEVAQKNEIFELRVKFINEHWLPAPYIELVPKASIRASLVETHHIGLMLMGRAQSIESILYKAHLCGLEEIGIDKVIYRSFFSFFKKEVKIEGTKQIKLLPEVRVLGQMQPFNEFLKHLITCKGTTHGADQVALDGEEVGYELRPYMEGDSKRLIHWKIAAYRNELLVRQRLQSSRQRNNIFLILNPFLSEREARECAVIEDKLLTTFISIVSYYLEREHEVQVAYYKNKVWKYIKMDRTLQIEELKKRLGDYTCLKVEETMNQRSILKSLIKIAEKTDGIKILVSSYWTQEMNEYIFRKQEGHIIPCIWVRDDIPRDLIEHSSMPIWHMNGAYDMEFGMIAHQKKER